MQRTSDSVSLLSYIPPPSIRRKYLAKKSVELIVYALAGLLVAWEAWPGLTAASSVNSNHLADPEYWVFIAGLFIAVTMLIFLVVVTWNQRLASIDAGRLTWPFPYRNRSGVRTRYVPLEEISEVRRTAESPSRRGADLILREGTQLFLPESVFGEDGSGVLDRLAQYVNRGPGGDRGGRAP